MKQQSYLDLNLTVHEGTILNLTKDLEKLIELDDLMVSLVDSSYGRMADCKAQDMLKQYAISRDELRENFQVYKAFTGRNYLI